MKTATIKPLSVKRRIGIFRRQFQLYAKLAAEMHAKADAEPAPGFKAKYRRRANKREEAAKSSAVEMARLACLPESLTWEPERARGGIGRKGMRTA